MEGPLIFALAGGFARLHDGGRLSLIQKLPPNLIYGFLSVSLWVFLSRPFEDNMLMLVTGVSCLVAWGSLQRSYGGWDSWRNVIHFWPVMLVSVGCTYLYDKAEWGAGYVVALVLIGALRPAFSKFAPTVHNWSRKVEFIEGAVVFGGLAAVSI